MGSADAGQNRAYLRQGSRWFLCEDYKLPTEKQPIDSTVEQNYCLLLKRCAIKDCSVVVTQLPKEFVKKTYANVIREPRRFPPKASSMENMSESREKPDLKRAFSSSESLQCPDDQHGKQAVDCCQGCKKPFARLYYHLTKTPHAASCMIWKL